MTPHAIKERLRQCKDMPELAQVWSEVAPNVAKLDTTMRIQCVNLKDQLKIIMQAQEQGYLG